jgi:hypothetical protein
MHSLGLEHGRRGLNDLLDDVRSTCGATAVGLENYGSGFSSGWDIFCTTYNGFQMGKKGDPYRSYCSALKEDLFHEKYFIGKKVYEKNDQVADLEEKIQDLVVEIEKDSTSFSLKDELKKYQNEFLILKREIQALEQQGISLVHSN